MAEDKPTTAGTDPPYLSVLLPVLNEKPALPELYTRLRKTLDGIGKSYELVFIDDGSTDGTIELLKEYQQADPNLRIVIFFRNFGQHAAMIAGFANAQGKYVVTLDADLQNPPEEIPRILAKLEEGYEVVNGWRKDRHDIWLRKIPSYFFNKIAANITGVYVNDFGCNLRGYQRHVTDFMVSQAEMTTHITVLPAWMGFKVAEIPVKHDKRQGGPSKYNFFLLAKTMNNILTGYTYQPIQVLGVLGFGVAFVSLVLFLCFFGLWFFYGDTMSPYLSLVALAFFVAGLQVGCTGLLGEYLVRIFFIVKKKPYYIIKEISEPPKD